MDPQQPGHTPIQHSWEHHLKLTSSDHYLQVANQYQHLGDTESAIKVYREALFYYPKLSKAYLNLGNSYEKLQNWKKARLTYQQGRAICPDSSENQPLFNQALARLDDQLKENKSAQTLSHLIYPFSQQATKLKKPVNPPKIAIVILNLNGAALLSELLQSIHTHNTYQAIELIIIDHGSSDQSHAVCTTWSNSLPIRFFNRNENCSFSNSNNFAVTKTDAPLLLFLNNDVVFCEDFLSQLVLLLQDESIGIIGVKFLQYQGSKSLSKRKDVQHLGVHFSFQQEHRLFRPYEIQDAKTFNAVSSNCWQVPAISGALMLCRREDFTKINGFNEGYFYGYEDLDLCLSFQKNLGKKVISLNQVKIYHHQSYTRKTSTHFKRQRQDNYRNLENRFGYFIRRSYLTDFFDKPLFWSGKPLCLGFAIVSQDNSDQKISLIKALGTHLSHQFGWHVYYISQKTSPQVISSLDIIVVTSLEFNWNHIIKTAKATLHKIFWLLQNPYEWPNYQALWNYDSIWLSFAQARQRLEKLLAKPACLIPIETQANTINTSSQAILSALSYQLKSTFRISIKISTSQWENAHLWGDYHFALGLKRALDRQGHSTRIDVLSEWNMRQAMGDDVVIVLRGLKAYNPKPSQINILWNISHPEKLELQELNAYDYIFVASIAYAERLSQTLQGKVEPLLQCTDPELFYRDLSKDFNVGQVIFVGNARKIYRPIVKHALETGIKVDVYGRGWEPFLPPGYVQQRHIPNHLLRHYYSRCGVLLNDHWETMGQNGFLSNRLFDAAACGATIISDRSVGLESVFDGHVITYQDAADLPKLVQACLQNRATNATTTAKLANYIHQEHSFDRRAERIIAIINQLHHAKMYGHAEPEPTPVKKQPAQQLNQAQPPHATTAQLLHNPNHAPKESELQTPEKLLKKATYLATEGQWQTVIQICKRLQECEPHNGESYQLLGDAHYNLGNLFKAIHAYKSATRFQPNAAWSHYNLGRALSQQRTWPDAIIAFQHAFNLSPSLPDIHRSLAHALEQQAIAENKAGLAAFYHNLPRINDHKNTNLEQAKSTLETLGKISLENFLASNSVIQLPSVENPKISIVLILFNRAELTLKCLQSIAQNTFKDYEVIIIDNDSTDATRSLLTQVRNAKIALNSENKHFLLACNQASQLAKGDYLLFLNNDTQVLDGSLITALETIKSAPDIGAVGGMIILPDGTLQEAGSIIWRNGSCQGYGRGDSPEKFCYQFRRSVDYCSAAFLLTPRQLFLDLEGFDPLFKPAYYEEADYCVRLLKQGKQVIFDPRIKLIHYEFASSKSSASSGQAITLQQQNREKFVQKHSEWLMSQYSRHAEHILWARSRDRKRILFIEDCVPHPSMGSGFPRAHKILSQMVYLGYFVTFYPLTTPAKLTDRTRVDIPAEVEILLGHTASHLGEFLESRENYYDIIWISRPHNLKVFNQVASIQKLSLAKVQIIYDAEAIFCLREFEQQRLKGKPPSDRMIQARLQQELNLSAPHCATVVTVCEPEQQVFIHQGHANVEVLGHALKVNPTPAKFHKRQHILFVGAIYSFNSPNTDSVIWFVNHIFPKIQNELGSAITLNLVGTHSIDMMPQLERSGVQDSVKFLGKVEDLSEIYNQHRLFVAPTRFAAGIPHKVHEAAAHGLPVVTTPLIVKQLQWQHGIDVLAAKQAEEFSRHCIQLYQDEALWTHLRENALKKVKRDCHPQQFSRKLAMILKNA